MVLVFVLTWGMHCIGAFLLFSPLCHSSQFDVCSCTRVGGGGDSDGVYVCVCGDGGGGLLSYFVMCACVFIHTCTVFVYVVCACWTSVWKRLLQRRTRGPCLLPIQNSHGRHFCSAIFFIIFFILFYFI